MTKKDNTDYNSLGEYVKKIADLQGIAVTTVSDGWVLLVTNQKLKELVEASSETGYAMIFIKSSEDTLKN